MLERTAAYDRRAAELWPGEQTGGRQRAGQMRVSVRVRDACSLCPTVILGQQYIARAHRIVNGLKSFRKVSGKLAEGRFGKFSENFVHKCEITPV